MQEGKDRKAEYYVVKKKAVPETLLKVVQVKRLLETNKGMTVQEATDRMLQMEDEPGLLSRVLGKIAEYRANVLTIHQTIPINGVASLTLSTEVLPTTSDVSSMIDDIEKMEGIYYLKILGRE